MSRKKPRTLQVKTHLQSMNPLQSMNCMSEGSSLRVRSHPKLLFALGLALMLKRAFEPGVFSMNTHDIV